VTLLLTDARESVDRLLVGVDDVSSTLTGITSPDSGMAALPPCDDVDDAHQLLAEVTRSLRGVRRCLSEILIRQRPGGPVEEIVAAVGEWEDGDLAANTALARVRDALRVFSEDLPEGP
jgi:hypothetical protein